VTTPLAVVAGIRTHMSYVISISRSAKKSPLRRGEIERYIDSDESLTRGSSGTVEWSDPGISEGFFLNIEDSSLWSDSIQGSDADSFLAKTRQIAAALDSDVFGEEGELLSHTAVGEHSAKYWGFTGLTGFVIFIIALPFLVLFLLFRIPLLLWQLIRTVK
jgi:hypothetical protein